MEKKKSNFSCFIKIGRNKAKQEKLKKEKMLGVCHWVKINRYNCCLYPVLFRTPKKGQCSDNSLISTVLDEGEILSEQILLRKRQSRRVSRNIQHLFFMFCIAQNIATKSMRMNPAQWFTQQWQPQPWFLGRLEELHDHGCPLWCGSTISPPAEWEQSWRPAVNPPFCGQTCKEDISCTPGI